MKKNVLSLSVAMATALVVAPVATFAASELKDSTASTVADATRTEGDMDGQDVTQSKVTEYADEITEDKTSACEVYATQASSFSVIIPKTVILNGKAGETNSGAYVVTAKGNIAGNEYVTVAPATETFAMKQAGKEDITATIAQAVSQFAVTEANGVVEFDAAKTVYGVDAEAGATADGTITVEGLSAGSWSGEFNFNIALNTFAAPAEGDGN